MPAYPKTAIIYNPKSTGKSVVMAKQFFELVRQKLPGQPAELIETTHAGHGGELAYAITQKTPGAVIVSVSGDGGYH